MFFLGFFGCSHPHLQKLIGFNFLAGQTLNANRSQQQLSRKATQEVLEGLGISWKDLVQFNLLLRFTRV